MTECDICARRLPRRSGLTVSATPAEQNRSSGLKFGLPLQKKVRLNLLIYGRGFTQRLAVLNWKGKRQTERIVELRWRWFFINNDSTCSPAWRSLWCFYTSLVLTMPSSLINKITFILYLFFSSPAAPLAAPSRCQLLSALVQNVCLYFTLMPFNHFHHFSELTFYIKSSYHPWLMLNDEWW